ncbi:MAG: LysR family transcriptional regulator, partial [Simplicispira sp.]|nr:LysR family transcriptional regulator [Simplicispira sp.]
VGVVPRSVLVLAHTPLALRLHPLCSIDTLLVRRNGYRSAALEALQQVLTQAETPLAEGAAGQH